MRLTRTKGIVLTLGALPLGAAVFTACSSNDTPSPVPSDAGTSDVAVHHDAAPLADTGADAPVADGNDAFETAEPITLGTPVDGAIDPPGDLDYYKFDGKAGQWILAGILANRADDTTALDTVVTLYDATHTAIAEADDANPRRGTDSILYTRLPADGTYYVLVQSFSTWMKAQPVGGPTFTYSLEIEETPGNDPQYTLDAETGNDASSATMLTYAPMPAKVTEAPLSEDYIHLLSHAYGTFKDASDVDVFSFKLPVTGTRTQVGFFFMQPSGPKGNGSTTSVGDTWVTDATGATVIAKFDATKAAHTTLAPPLAPGATYLLWLKHPATATDANDFYYVDHDYTDENPPEAEVAPARTNDTAATAETVTLAADPQDAKGKVGYIAGTISFAAPPATAGDAGTDGGDAGATDAGATTPDVDYFAFHANIGQTVVLSCSGATDGAGLVSAQVSLRSSEDADLGTVVETDTTPLLLGSDPKSPITIPSSGTYYLRYTAAAPAAGNAGNWYRCRIDVVSTQ